MKSKRLGVFSCFVAALVWIGTCGGVITILGNQLYFFKNETGMWSVQIGFLIGLGLALFGAGLAVGGLMQPEGKKGFAVSGLICNGLALLGGLGLFCLSLG